MKEETFVKSKAEDFNGNLEFWMSHLPPFLKRLPIIHLAIPGSHDTMTYTIKRFNDVGPDQPIYIRRLARFLPFITKPIIYNWLVTQYDDVREQLNGGIRYLDLRLATKPNNDGVYFLHGLYGSEVTESLCQIDNWLDSHPDEFIIVDCQHFYSFTVAHHRNFIDNLKATFRNKICPVERNIGQINLQWLNEMGYRIIIIYRNEIARNERDLWPNGLWPTPWPNTVDPRTLVHFLDVKLRSRHTDIGYVSQCLLTPNARYVLRHLCGSLHTNLTKVCRNKSLPWIREHTPGNGGLNVVITDFVSYDNYLFSHTVIERNYALLRISELAATSWKY